MGCCEAPAARSPSDGLHGGELSLPMLHRQAVHLHGTQRRCDVPITSAKGSATEPGAYTRSLATPHLFDVGLTACGCTPLLACKEHDGGTPHWRGPSFLDESRRLKPHSKRVPNVR
jgi:hypothetical protein